MRLKVPGSIQSLGDVPICYKRHDDWDGAFCAREQKIFVSTQLPLDSIEPTIIHELFHYAISASGLSVMLSMLTDYDKDGASPLEESIVTCLDNFLAETGVLKINKDKVSSWKNIEFKGDDDDK